MSEIIILAEGYSKDVKEMSMRANCSCVLVKDNLVNIIVDTMTPWDKDLILESLLTRAELDPEDINFVVNTHGHSDHTGNNNLFLKAKHILGDSVSQGDFYEFLDLKGKIYNSRDPLVKNLLLQIPTTKSRPTLRYKAPRVIHLIAYP